MSRTNSLWSRLEFRASLDSRSLIRATDSNHNIHSSKDTIEYSKEFSFDHMAEVSNGFLAYQLFLSLAGLLTIEPVCLAGSSPESRLVPLSNWPEEIRSLPRSTANFASPGFPPSIRLVVDRRFRYPAPLSFSSLHGLSHTLSAVAINNSKV